jgi:hypothetical protein
MYLAFSGKLTLDLYEVRLDELGGEFMGFGSTKTPDRAIVERDQYRGEREFGKAGYSLDTSEGEFLGAFDHLHEAIDAIEGGNYMGGTLTDEEYARKHCNFLDY